MLSSAANRAWWRGYVQVRVHPRPGLRPSVVAPRTETPARRRGIDVSPATLRPQRSLWVVPHAPLRFCHWIRERSRLSSAGRPAESVQGPVEFRPRNRTDDQWSLVREESWRPKRPTESLSAAHGLGIGHAPPGTSERSSASARTRPGPSVRPGEPSADPLPPRSTSMRFVGGQTRRGAFATIETKRCSGATGVPRETITKEVLPPCAAARRCVDDGGVYRERRPQRRVNTHCSNLLVATRPLNSMRLAVREKASRIRPVGRAVTAPTLDQGDEGAGEPDDEAAAVASGSPAGAGVADPRPAMARLASAGPPLRASSIIPSNRPRMETPRRAASASTQARRSWSRRMPTTVDLEVAMAPLTVIRAVYISGAEWWQPGGGHRGGDRFRIGSGPHRQRTEATARHLPRPGSLSDVQTSSCPWTPERIRTPGGVRAAAKWSLTPHPGTHVGTNSRRATRGGRRSPSSEISSPILGDVDVEHAGPWAERP